MVTLTQQGHEADADGKQGAETEAYVLSVDGQRHFTVAPSVALGAVAGELRGWVSDAGPALARPRGTQRVHTGLPAAIHLDHVTTRTPAD